MKPDEWEHGELNGKRQIACEELAACKRELQEARRLAEIASCNELGEILRNGRGNHAPLASASPVMVVTVSPEGRIVAINAACATLLGYSAEELTGLPVEEIYHEEDRKECAEVVHNCLTNPLQVHRRQFRKIRKNGSVVWVEETTQAIRDLRGTLAVQIVCQDITEQKRASDEKEQLLVQLHAVLDSINEGVVIADLDGNVLSMNPAALAMHEFTASHEVRRQLRQFADIFELTELSGRVLPVSEWPLTRALRGERFTDYEVKLRRKDTGTELIVGYSGTPVRTREGEFILTVLVLRDITTRKGAEQALRISEEKFSTIFQTVPALLLISTYHEGRIIDANRTTLQTLGYQRHEIIGRTVHDIRLWDHPEERAKLLQLLEERRSVQNHEITFRSKGGELITGLLSAETIELEGERCLVILVKDISDRKIIEEEVYRLNDVLAARAAELEASNQELEAFNYTVAHDLRRPLNVINGYCQFLQEACGMNLDHTCQEYLEESYQATVLMNQLIGDLLNFSRLSRVKPQREEVDLSAMAKSLAKELMRTAEERKVDFAIEEGMTLHADPSLMRVVLENLMGNAWKFTGRKGEAVIEVGSISGDGEAIYFVRDNGTGFRTEDAKTIFLPFQRLPTPEEFKGSGIGLATVERVIHRHGGRIWAEGKPGEGATFYFTVGE